MRLYQTIMPLFHFLRSLSQLIFPVLCEGCFHPLTEAEKVLCLHCAVALPRTAYHSLPENETTLRLAGRFRFENASSFLYFSKDGLTQRLLHQIKYEGRQELAHYLAALFSKELLNTEWMNKVDAILAVPLHPEKEAKRGFNQSELFAATIARTSDKELLRGVLKRTRFTDTQTLKSRSERLENLSSAFETAENSMKAENKHLLLIDDVLTTGATIEACALALSHIPGIRISIATLAIAHQ